MDLTLLEDMNNFATHGLFTNEAYAPLIPNLIEALEQTPHICNPDVITTKDELGLNGANHSNENGVES